MLVTVVESDGTGDVLLVASEEIADIGDLLLVAVVMSEEMAGIGDVLLVTVVESEMTGLLLVAVVASEGREDLLLTVVTAGWVLSAEIENERIEKVLEEVVEAGAGRDFATLELSPITVSFSEVCRIKRSKMIA